MIKSIIVAYDENNGIGFDNKLLAYIPRDLKYFKETTNGHTVIMGRKTFESLPKGVLPNRRNIIISRNPDYVVPNGSVYQSLEEALAACELNEALGKCSEGEQVFIMGGGSVYKEAIEKDYVDEIYVTKILHTFPNVDTWFPTIDSQKFSLNMCNFNPSDDFNVEFQKWVKVSQ